MAEKDFLIKLEDFTDKIDPHGIDDLKKATYKQLKEINVI